MRHPEVEDLVPAPAWHSSACPFEGQPICKGPPWSTRIHGAPFVGPIVSYMENPNHPGCCSVCVELEDYNDYNFFNFSSLNVSMRLKQLQQLHALENLAASRIHFEIP